MFTKKEQKSILIVVLAVVLGFTLGGTIALISIHL